MSAGVATPDADDAADVAAGQRRVLSRRSAVMLGSVVTLVAAVAAAGVWFAHWRSDLHYFGGHGNVLGADHLPVGKTMYFGAFVQPLRDGRDLNVQSLVPVVKANTAYARIRVLVCKPAAAVGGVYSLEPFCTSVVPFQAGRYRLTLRPAQHPGRHGSGPALSTVIIAITPTRPGHVYIAGCRITYSAGIRHGSQQTGIEMSITTPR